MAGTMHGHSNVLLLLVLVLIRLLLCAVVRCEIFTNPLVVREAMLSDASVVDWMNKMRPELPDLEHLIDRYYYALRSHYMHAIATKK